MEPSALHSQFLSNNFEQTTAIHLMLTTINVLCFLQNHEQQIKIANPIDLFWFLTGESNSLDQVLLTSIHTLYN
jgi:hypothetical protein